MNTAFSVAALVGGIVLLVFGYNEYQSAGSEIAKFFTGNPSDRAIWMLTGGAILSVLGLVGLMRGSRRR
jgi:hypothetical protein